MAAGNLVSHSERPLHRQIDLDHTVDRNGQLVTAINPFTLFLTVIGNLLFSVFGQDTRIMDDRPLLLQRIAEIEAENVELKVANAELRQQVEKLEHDLQKSISAANAHVTGVNSRPAPLPTAAVASIVNIPGSFAPSRRPAPSSPITTSIHPVLPLRLHESARYRCL